MTVMPLGTAAPVVDTNGVVWEPSRPWEQITRDLNEGLRAMRSRRGDIDVYWNYYDGDHVQVWLTDSLRKAFGGRGMNDLQDNYCELVVNAPLSRMAITGWRSRRPEPIPEGLPDGTEPPVAPEVEAAADQWDDNDMDLEADDPVRAALVTGWGYVQVWPKMNADGLQETHPDTGLPRFEVVAKDPRNVYVKPGAKLRSRRWACQIWLDVDRWRATLYYSDMDGLPAEVVRLHTPPAQSGKASGTFPQQAGRFIPDAEDPGGPMPEMFGGKCPVVPFRLDLSGKSWLRDAVPVQDKINKLAANKMVTAEFLAFPQRYVLTDQEIPNDVLRYSPATMLKLAAGGALNENGEVEGRTQVGEFSAADLETYDKSQAREIEKLFTIKRLPKHLMVNQGSEPSGDAIKADEGPFVSFVRLLHRMMGASWQDVQQLMGNDVVPVWADPTVHNEEALSREFLNYRQGDVPLGEALRHVGWDEEQIRDAVAAELEARQQAAESARQQSLASALLFDQGRAGDQTDEQVTEE